MSLLHLLLCKFPTGVIIRWLKITYITFMYCIFGYAFTAKQLQLTYLNGRSLNSPFDSSNFIISKCIPLNGVKDPKLFNVGLILCILICKTNFYIKMHGTSNFKWIRVKQDCHMMHVHMHVYLFVAFGLHFHTIFTFFFLWHLHLE